MSDHTEDALHDPAAEVVETCRDLIRMDTSNYGDEEGPGERKAAEYVATLLDEVGIESRLYESEPGRTSLVAHWGGTPGDKPGLLLHGHLDVVPAAAEDWQVDPFSGEIRDGYLWGRGAVDMKDFDAMLLSVVRARTRAGRVPDAADRALLHRRRGGRRPQGRRGDRRAAPRGARALHRGGQRGRRLLGHHPRPPDVPHRGRREGHGLDAAHRPGQGRARVDDQPRERDHRAVRGRGPDRCLRVAGPADPDHEGAARLRRGDGRHRGDAGQRGGAGGGVRHRDPHARRP